MRNLITAQEVIDLAFAENSNMMAESISDTSIRIAEIKYIRPAFGAMYPLLADKYADYTNDYVKPALAYFVKCEIVSSIAIDMSNSGVAVANPQYQSAATDKQRQRLYDSEMSKAKTLLDFALEYIATHSEEFPDFSGEAPKKHHRLGGIILGNITTPKSSSSISGEFLKAELEGIYKRVEMLEMGGDVIELFATTHASLLALRDAGELTKGAFYRITDYECTTTQADTRSANHPFDIIVQALDERTLSENASAIQREGDTYFADAKLEAWQLKYTIDNDTTRFSWAQEEITEKPAKWTCGWGVLEEKNSADASSNYEVATIDGKQMYLYRPITPNNDFLREKITAEMFYREVEVGSITSTDGFIYEADRPIIYNEEEEYYEDYPDEIRVKTENGQLIATLYNSYDNVYYDSDDDSQEYTIGFEDNNYEEVDGVYHLHPSWGLDSWWDGFMGGAYAEYEREYYTGSADALYYAFSNPLGKNKTKVTMVTDKKHLYQFADTDYEDWEEDYSTIDYVTYEAYIAPVEGGKGVIYRMIDEHNNDCPYDFKNMQFLHDEKLYYTFSCGGEDLSLSDLCVNNFISKFSMRAWTADKTAQFAHKLPMITLNALPNNSGKYIGLGNNRLCVPIIRGFITATRVENFVWEAYVQSSDAVVNNLYINATNICTHNKISGITGEFIVGSKETPVYRFAENSIACSKNWSGGKFVCSANSFIANILNLEDADTTLVITGGSFTSCHITNTNVTQDNQDEVKFNADTILSECSIKIHKYLRVNYPNTTSSSTPLRFLNIDARGWDATTITIPSTFPANANYELKVAKNSKGEIKMWCDADLIQ